MRLATLMALTALLCVATSAFSHPANPFDDPSYKESLSKLTAAERAKVESAQRVIEKTGSVGQGKDFANLVWRRSNSQTFGEYIWDWLIGAGNPPISAMLMLVTHVAAPVAVVAPWFMKGVPLATKFGTAGVGLLLSAFAGVMLADFYKWEPAAFNRKVEDISNGKMNEVLWRKATQDDLPIDPNGEDPWTKLRLTAP